jgi:iron complex transport system substrate-binding protein
MSEHRVVSLIPSATEIVAALGFEQELAGRSHECDFPAGVARLPACSNSRVDAAVSSSEIDSSVKSLVAEGRSVYRVDADLLDRLQPTLIITQSQCDLCAVSLDDVREALATFSGVMPEILTLEPMSLADVWDDVRRVGAALDVSDRAERLVQSYTGRLDRISERCGTADAVHCPTVATIEWIEPLMAAGNWVPSLVQTAGGRNLFGAADVHSAWIDFESLVAADPEIIVIMPCGFDIPRIRLELAPLRNRPEWHELRAVRSNRVCLADGSQYFNRPGPRLVESAEILAELIHPELFSFGHEGAGWERLPKSNDLRG